MPFKDQDRQSHWTELRTRLESLRPIFPSGGKGETFCALFDEFLKNREFGHALEVLCDFLWEPDVPAPSETEFNEMAALHALMETEDDCLLRLHDKRRSSQSANETI